MNIDNFYSTFDTFVFRAPLLPITDTKLRRIDRDIFKEAVFLATPDLHATHYSKSNGSLQSVTNSIVKYYNRACTRPTPFGIFAGCGVGHFDTHPNSDIKLGEICLQNTRTRLDMSFCCLLLDQLNRQEEIKSRLLYFVNSSMYKIGNNYRYVECKIVEDKNLFYQSEIEYSVFLEDLFSALATGLQLKDISSLIRKYEYEEEDINEFIDELISNQVLVSELSPTVIGDDLLGKIIDILNLRNIDHYYVERLKVIDAKLKNIDSQQIGKRSRVYEELYNLLNNFSLPVEKKHFLQTDLFFKESEAVIGTNLLNSIKDGLTALNKLSSLANPAILSFKEIFRIRYESRKVPLVEVLDPEIGIGFGDLNVLNNDINPLIDDLPLYVQNKISETTPSSNKDKFLYQRFVKSQMDGAYEILLTQEELIDLKEEWSNLPPTFASMVSVISNDDDPLVFMDSAWGSAGCLISRFGHLDNRIKNLLREISDKEAEVYGPDEIVAEILHLPEFRMGNILYRPSCRDYEIPYLAFPTVTNEFQIPITDILVSINGNNLILTSQKTGKRIIPRLTSAHNFRSSSLPVYAFLSSLQNEGERRSIFFDWGNLVGSQSFYPRVVFENVIISPATWKLNRRETLDAPLDPGNLVEWSNAFKKEKKMPSQILLVMGDNKLYFDLDDEESLVLLFSEIRGKDAKLEEFLYKSKNNLVTNSDGDYLANEIIISFYKNKK
ncbi:lantibiotic dehydratase family protein [Niabella pedocola]|uniref:Lantibiotic dehydratase family protein n=1 Tax=Niabella pedocola TaxID=1752077 RepID=A0ABS8PTM1_9BACT|nr:lantibiotic dehydratase family protein [Niabella pedocola]MCD2424425.1 lantibiotic dehydratase family protein [Niabella pedocola]